jgi:transglutaminase-like putative cysteine protease
MVNRIICVIMIVIAAVSSFAYPVSAAALSEFERTKIGVNTAADTYFDGSDNKPSEWARAVVQKAVEQGFVPDSLKNSYQRPVTLGEYAQLYVTRYSELADRLFQSDYYKISLSDASVTDEAPDYIKFAFLVGLIDHTDDLNLTMTRKEAAVRFSRLIGASVSAQGSTVSVRDNLEVSPDALDAVGIATAYNIINPIDGYFMPNSAYTVEQAIYDIHRYEYPRYGYNYIRGIIDLAELYKSSIEAGRDFLFMSFEDKNAAEDYIKYNVVRRVSFYDGYIEGRQYDVPITGKHQKIDVGYMIIELNSPDYDVKYTFKKGAENIDVRNFTGLAITYGKDNYRSEPREIKPGEQVSMEAQPDSIHQKLYEKVDEILKQIIKPDMTQVQKVKAIHDYVVTKVAYSSGSDILIGDNALKAIETGKGVCVHYTMLFYHLCKRADIPVRNIMGNSFVGSHSWNAVYVDGKWLHVDTTLDDAKGKISYEYYLKDSDYMLKTRFFNGYGVSDQQYYTDIDGMNIQSADELRAYLIRQVEVENIPDTIKFRLANKNIDTNVEFLRFIFFEGKYKVKYDAKQDLYIATKYR